MISAVASQDALELLSSLACSTHEAWCFSYLNSTDRYIGSRAFRSLFRIGEDPQSATPDSDNGRILFAEHAIAAAFESHGFSMAQFREWCREAAHESVVIRARIGVDQQYLATELLLSVEPVLTQEGHPLGRISYFRPLDLTGSVPLLTTRSLRAVRLLQMLSPREREVLQLLYSGRSNKEIAAAAEISTKTVEKHRASITEKLKTKSVPLLIRLVADAALLDPTLAAEPVVPGNGLFTAESSH